MSLPFLILAAAFGAVAPPVSDSVPGDSVPLYNDLGSYHFAVTTKVPAAQSYFDQGLRLVYGFNHGEAIRAFTEATRLDPNCAMCYWGIAYALRTPRECREWTQRVELPPTPRSSRPTRLHRRLRPGRRTISRR